MVAGSSMTYNARTTPVSYSGPPTKLLRDDQCQDECAEEDCFDPDNCGDESRPPKPENLFCGIDTRPLLPVTLAVTTVIGMLCMMMLQLPLLSRLLDVNEVYFPVAFLILYVVTLGCMTYCAFCDPGQLRKDQQAALGSDGEQPNLPKRTYKSWQYKRPIRRYDHYCRWLSNVIGLLNHREFLVMLVGLILISVLGAAVDLTLAYSILFKGFWSTEIVVVLHFAYSVALLALAGPILKIHVGLISRNETASEWKRNEFYIAKVCKKGMDVPVNDLSDDEFNSLFDSFFYDRRRNTLDRGCSRNCFTFWCEARWDPNQKGDF